MLHERIAGVDGSIMTSSDHHGVPPSSAIMSALGFQPQRLKGSEAQRHNCWCLVRGHEGQQTYRYRNPHRLDCDLI